MTLTLKTPSIPFYTSLLESTNIMIVKCYKLLGNSSHYTNNIGFLLFLTIIILMELCMIFYYCHAKSSLYIILFNKIKSSPNVNIHSSISFDSSQRNVIEKKPDVVEKLQRKETDINLDTAPYKIAVKQDHRIFCRMFFDNCISKI